MSEQLKDMLGELAANDLPSWAHDMIKECQVLAEGMTKREALLTRTLEMVEWVTNPWNPEGGYSRVCAWCKRHEEHERHAPDCPRQKALGIPYGWGDDEIRT
jgi:hypothetical protein